MSPEMETTHDDCLQTVSDLSSVVLAVITDVYSPS